MRVVLTPRAERHLDALHAYITDKARRIRADACVARITVICAGPATFPMRGRKRDDLMHGLRTVGFERRATVAFVVSADTVLIEAIFYVVRTLKPPSETSNEHGACRIALSPEEYPGSIEMSA